MSAVKDPAGLVRYAQRNPGAIELYMASRAEHVTLELASAYNERPHCLIGRPNSGWDTMAGRDDAVRMLVREHCA